jgi:hypothetical protein
MSSHDRQFWTEQLAQGRAISTALGEGWILRDNSPAPDEWRAWHLRRLEDGLELDLTWEDKYSQDWRSKRGEAARLAIGGVWPKDHEGQSVVPSQTEREGRRTQITVDQTKPAAVIAKDIERRLLSSFTNLHKRAMEIVRSRAEYGSQTEQTMRAILAAIPGAHRGEHSKTTIYLGEDNYAYTCVVQGESVRFEAFTAPLPAALVVLQALQKKPAAPETVDCPTCGGSEYASVDNRVVDCPNPKCYQGQVPA